MNILITGGAGFIGSHLAARHLKNGDSVTVIDNLITGSKQNIDPLLTKEHFIFYENDVLAFHFSLFTFHFDIVYHLASPASPIQYQKRPLETLRVNSEGTRLMLELLKKQGAGVFVLASTSEVYGDPLEHPQREAYFGNVNPVGPRACYDEGKRFAEAITKTYQRLYDMDVRIARIFNTYGPNMEKDDGRVISNFIMQSLKGDPITIYGDGSQTRSFCFVDDMVEGLMRLASAPKLGGMIVNLGNTEEKTIAELAVLIKALTKTSSEIVKGPLGENDPKQRKPDISKARKLLGWEPKISLEEGLQKTIDYFRTRFL